MRRTSVEAPRRKRRPLGTSQGQEVTRSEMRLRKSDLERDFTKAELTTFGDWLGSGR